MLTEGGSSVHAHLGDSLLSEGETVEVEVEGGGVCSLAQTAAPPGQVATGFGSLSTAGKSSHVVLGFTCYGEEEEEEDRGRI